MGAPAANFLYIYIYIYIEDAMRRGIAAPAFKVGGLLFIVIDVHRCSLIFLDFR